MSGWHTRFDRPAGVALAGAGPGLSPSLLFFKWHPFDGSPADPKLTSTEARSPFLERVAELGNGMAAGQEYGAWHKRYLDALRGTAADRLVTTSASTVWRLVIGLGSNPAFEAGLQLHPLYGFPILPGSAVRGLVHHVAEHELLESEERRAWLERLPTAEERQAVAAFLADAAVVRALLGSLSVEPHKFEGETLGWPAPRALLKEWSRAPESGGLPVEWKEFRPQIRRLTEEHTGGMVTFYDAVPAPGQEGLLQIDLVNPHYPAYYRDPSHPPSDDQDPVPVTFLAVRPGAAFDFAFSVAPLPGLPGSEPRDDEERERAAALAGLDRQSLQTKVAGWLRQGLETWGVGGKTAAGYGYMKLSDPPASGPVPQAASSWKDRVGQIRKENAQTEVPRLLAELTGAEKQEAAEAIIQELHGRWLRKRPDQSWVRELFAAAQGEPAEE
jgi:CRISPR type III-B/RAMP module RAMP protein Cmr6